MPLQLMLTFSDVSFVSFCEFVSLHYHCKLKCITILFITSTSTSIIIVGYRIFYDYHNYLNYSSIVKHFSYFHIFNNKLCCYQYLYSIEFFIFWIISLALVYRNGEMEPQNVPITCVSKVGSRSV